MENRLKKNRSISRKMSVLTKVGIFAGVLLLFIIIGIVCMLTEMWSSSSDLVEGLISQLSEKTDVSAGDPSTVIAGLALMESQFNTTLSQLSILLTAFFTVTAFVSIGIPLIERRMTENLAAEVKALQSSLEDEFTTVKKEQKDFILLMHSLYNVSEIARYDSDQPSIATLAEVTEIDTTAAISKYIIGMVQYKKAHHNDSRLTDKERKRLLYESAKYYNEAIDATDDDRLCGLYYYLRSLAYYEISFLPVTPDSKYEISEDEKEDVIECAIKSIKSAIDRDESNPSYHSVLANILRESGGNYVEARSEMCKAIDLRKKQIEASHQVHQPSMVTLNKPRVKDYALAEYYMWLGVIEHESSKYEEAIKCKEKAIDYGYNKNEMQVSIIVSRFMSGERYYARCIDQMELILNELEKTDDGVGGLEKTGYPEYLYWAKSYLGQIKIKKALSCNPFDTTMITCGIRLLDEAIEHQHNYRNLLRRGQAYIVLVQGNAFTSKEEKDKYLNQGFQDLQKSLKLNPNYPDTWYAMYIYYKFIGDETAALRCWNPKGEDDRIDRHNYTKTNHKPEPFGKDLYVT